MPRPLTGPNEVEREVHRYHGGNQQQRFRNRDSRARNEQDQQGQPRAGTVRNHPLGKVVDELWALKDPLSARRMHNSGEGERNVGESETCGSVDAVPLPQCGFMSAFQ